ncbi:DNA polymerase phi-domain-containing protein [Elsinoe ampelina]|uniref:DNA polymerase phi-domain-containing protein n=1 Tax=Elsinoe ampelina TaxID=302913 RepID=A0A6A6FZE8_9PEZI|nr:DNA polymerase phi-domain-containing protein [Elsinoe ampelina]
MGTKRRREEKVSAQDSSGPTDDQHPRKRIQKYTEDDSRLAKWFGDLAEDVRSTRLSACKEIILFLEKATKDQKDRILQRLIRGLCSSRKSARLGFSLTFTALLDKLCGHAASADWDYQVSDLLPTVESLTSPPSNANNQEKRDYQLGRCLAYRAFIQSKALYALPVPEGVAISNQLLDHIFALYKRAPFIRQECGTTANSLLSTAGGTDPAYATALLQAYHQHGLLKTSDGLAAWLDGQQLFPEGLDLPTNVWHNNDPLSPQERSTLVKILRDNVSDTDIEGSSSTGQAQKIPCLAWVPVLDTVARRSKQEGTGQSDPSFFSQFWKEAVDDAFFSAKASSERKAIGLQIVRLAIIKVDAHLVSELLSPHVVRCIINQRSSPSNSLHAAADTPLRTLCQRSKQQPELGARILRTTFSTIGLPNLDKLTRSKTIDELLSHVLASDAEEVLQVIDSNISRPKTSEHADVEVCQRSYADLLLTFARKQRPQLPSSALTEQHPTTHFPWTKLFSIMAQHAYLVKKGAEPLSTTVQEMFQARIMSCLTHTMESGLDPNFEHSTHVVTTINKLVKSGKHTLILKADQNVMDVLSKAASRLHSARKAVKDTDNKDRPILQAFKLLFSLSILQVHNGDADAVSMLEELDQCYETSATSTSSISLLIEILLGFLSRPSALFRKLAEQVFTAISTQVDEDGLQALLEILQKPENLSGQQELFDNADDMADMADDASDDNSEESSGSSDDLEASDVEMVDANGNGTADTNDSAEGSSEDDDDNDNDSSDSSDDEADSPPDDELTAFESKLAQTLGTSKIATGEDDDDTSDDSDMDDDQMMALDGHLTKIFQERTKVSSKKKDNKDAKGNVINFKNRVLDLLGVFIKQCYSRPLVLDLIAPLLQLIRTTTNKELSTRAYNVLKSLFDTCAKHKSFPTAPTEDLFAALAAVHDELKASPSKIHASATSRSSLFLVKVAVTQDRANYALAADMYSTLQKAWYADPRSKIPSTAFTEWTSWSINSRK